MKRFLMAAACLLLTVNLSAQLNITNTTSVVDVVQNALLGQGIVVSNISYNGSTANVGSSQGNVKLFNDQGGNFPFSSGVLLTTDGGSGTVSYDPDLTAIATNNVTNGVVLEFDFIPTGDTLSFNYMFASSEYPNYVCSGFNDVFGFFISGPGFNGPFQYNAENIALVPNTNVPVAINTVNSGSAGGSGNPTTCANQDPNWQSNSVYYTTSYNGTTGYPYGGGTVSLSANADLICGQTYHIKIAISNVGDQALNSGVFLEANSFSSNTVDISISSDQSVNDSTLVEGCTQGTVTFSRPTTQTGDTLIVVYTTGGQAVEGVDYTSLGQNGIITFLPGEDTISIVIDPIQDGIDEGPELLTINAYTITPCGDTVYSEGFTYITEEPFSEVIVSDTTIYCDNDSVLTEVYTIEGFEPYTYEWIQLPNGNVYTSGDSVYLEAYQNQTNYYIVQSTDACGFVFEDTMEIIVDQTLAVDTAFAGPTPCGESSGFVTANVSGNVGQPQLNWSGPGPNSPNGIDASAWGNLSSGWYYFEVSDSRCTVYDSAFVDQESVPVADFTATPSSGTAPLPVTFTNNSTGGSSYEWDFGNGNGVTVFDLGTQYQTYGDAQNVYDVSLIVYGGSCSDTAWAQITIIPFLALDYSKPNVFTPDGDNKNDVFTFNPVNAKNIDVVITNRWGNVVFESTGDPTQAVWDGTNKSSGNPCGEGTYFYQATFYGFQGEEVQEQGFIQLVK
ncbi:gliding motility-associated C-terminal domain-containing protein [Lishizhenia tianjinensis]|uniref:Gliding motility-associated C-terminal domain-containing protein n=1 Tax=Lishizhenia tianjinensis TaxID=477690 RepID=A0A1I7AW58_9FLAO|nr:choice-of-anchor L domain-containing protein [Lishizhenia tianjinensis]SFT79130.1 gliding motility-associated C-terminal domain-containing protein [Lishizhenia tianjinensis]